MVTQDDSGQLVEEIEKLLNDTVGPYGYMVCARPRNADSAELIFGVTCEGYNEDKQDAANSALNALFPSMTYKNKRIVIKMGLRTIAL